ncbi:2-oxo-4-hydroxy-4-carboxy-5-ureidoimidazoline decarboxylase [Glutamicibacter sp. PS]|uniref:2-oxo-4-hydroxy-4-carboxy-5-ureidoimidazoline decarboxylase n=1 Tax=Glutamicibacter sp. PS TaxID=3075634 RepID=UPI00284D21E4|nr:2-oxo-4-hydroxy-4-carboxy-5-ureidoimidazoline decarboxylase [Glutamicibacter sp. PS]MDR4534632.1 2-oxo-4-hydroxy-4-carboxy-5-ureidoimidazoline decarboxylase [Glutamicibacter sp. PS]
MDLESFNTLSDSEAGAILRPCIDIDRWVDEVLSARPFGSVDELQRAAERSANPFTEEEVNAALAHHPRIGERAEGESKEANLSRGEQSGLSLDDEAKARLVEANREYEQRFNRVFLIRAAGRTTEEILAECQRRVGNDDATEMREVAEQLRAIALLRLSNAINN